MGGKRTLHSLVEPVTSQKGPIAMLRFVLQKSDTEDDDLILMIDEAGLEALQSIIQQASRTGHEHLIENKMDRSSLTNNGDPCALKHVLIDWFGANTKSG